MRLLCVMTIVVAIVIAACTNTESPVTPRASRLSARLHARSSVNDSAILSSSTSQAIKGWGFYPGGGVGVFLSTTSPSGPAAEDSLYSMGATFIRDRLDPGLYDSGTTYANIAINTTMLNSYIAKWDTAKLKGMGYVLSVWSPPASMVSSGHLKSSSDSAFVAFITKVLVDLSTSSAGSPIAVSIANEPDVASGVQYSDTMWQNIIEMTRGALTYQGLTGVTLFGPETSTYDSVSYFLGGSAFDTLDRDYLSRDAVGAFAWHTYGQCNYTTVQSFVTSYPRDAWVTEFSKPILQGSNDLAYAIDGMAALGANLTLVSNNYWAWWYGFAVDTGMGDSTNGDYGSLVDANKTSSWVLYSRRYFLLQKLWTLVKPGSWNLQKFTFSSDTSLRINGNGNQSTCQYRDDIYAFENSSDTSTVVVASNHTSADKYVTVIGFPTSYKRQHAWRADTSTVDSLAVEDSSTVWQVGTTSRTTLYVPARSVIVALMQP